MGATFNGTGTYFSIQNEKGILKRGEKPVHYLCEGFLGLGSRLTALREPPTAAAERPAAD